MGFESPNNSFPNKPHFQTSSEVLIDGRETPGKQHYYLTTFPLETVNMPPDKRDKMFPSRQRPKRLMVFRKSATLRKWLLRNPWIRPMCVFNFAVVRIQQVGFRQVLHMDRWIDGQMDRWIDGWLHRHRQITNFTGYCQRTFLLNKSISSPPSSENLLLANYACFTLQESTSSV